MTTHLACAKEGRFEKYTSAIFFGLLFIAGYINNAIYPSFVNAVVNIPRIANASIGELATAEFLAFGIAIIVAGKFLPARRLRLTVFVSVVVHIVTSYAMTVVPPDQLLPIRALYGAASGVFVAISYLYLARSATPGKLVAIYTTGLMVTSVVWSIIAPNVIVPLLGYPSIFLFLTFFSILALFLLRFCPDQWAPLSDSKAEKVEVKLKLSLAPTLILISVGMWAIYMTVFWVYADPIVQKIPGSLVKSWLTISLICQIAGAASSAYFVQRLPIFPVLTFGLILSALQVIIIMWGVSGVGFVVWTGISTFLGYFMVPFFIRLLSDIDVTKKSVLLFPGVQMLASSIGPMMVSQMVSETDLKAVLAIDAWAVVIALLTYWCGVAVYRRVAYRNRDIKNVSANGV